MFKLPIVELEREKSGEMFSIRDFRRLYARVYESELSALRRLFVAILHLPATSTTSFEKHVLARWKSLVPGTAAADIEKALGALDLKRDKRAMKHSEFKKDVAGNFSQMVYAVRNAIVHNKETEFHLTYATLDKTISTLIESFLLPCLEEICFALIGSTNPYVWYANKEMLLYK